ncbi:hypothetical protein DL764_009323 [Monosporascus ibericus]|uniref:Uncharacterized protein n=1 Tax=Monosporascus ibericus TaxID=155417 RepID=A0A4Q4SV86_9PEZI|nr:hypothetical protein DL764_009323 [Monosporascus ibericus]
MMDPDAELVMGDKVETDNTTVPAGGDFIETQEEGIQVEKFLPDGYGRVFHPQILLHEIIANLVIYNMINHNQEKNGLPTYPEVLTLDSCPLTTSEPTQPTELPTGPTTTATAAPIPDCAMDRPARIPWDVFYGPEFNVASDFCKEVEKDPNSPHAWTVNNKGEKLSDLKIRTPPTDPGSYRDYEIGLSWEPADGFNESACPHSCDEAYKTIATSPCNCPQNPLYLMHLLTHLAKGGHTGGGQNTMAKDGSWDIGCGMYSWNIRIPSDLDPYVPLKLGSQGCNNEDDFSGHQAMQQNDIYWGAIGTCLGVEDELGPGDSWESQIGGRWQGTTFNFKVKWVPGCITDVKKQKLNNPLGVTNVCIDLFYGNWKNCKFQLAIYLNKS